MKTSRIERSKQLATKEQPARFYRIRRKMALQSLRAEASHTLFIMTICRPYRICTLHLILFDKAIDSLRDRIFIYFSV